MRMNLDGTRFVWLVFPTLLIPGICLWTADWYRCVKETPKATRQISEDSPREGSAKTNTTPTELSFVLRKDNYTVRVEPRGDGKRLGVRIGQGKWHEWPVPNRGIIERMDLCRWVPHRQRQLGFAVGLQVVDRKEKSQKFYLAVFILDYFTNHRGVLAPILPESRVSDAPFHLVKRAGISQRARLAGVSNPKGDSIEVVILRTDSNHLVRADVYQNPCPIASLENTIFSLVTAKTSTEHLPKIED